MKRLAGPALAALSLLSCGAWDDFAWSIGGEWRRCLDTRTGPGECLSVAPSCIEDAFAGCVQTRAKHHFDAGDYEATQYVFVYPEAGGCRVTLFEDHAASGRATDRAPRVYECSRLARDGCGHYTGLDCTPR